MEGVCEKGESESLSTGVFELPGEPAVVINGVPDVPVDGNSSSGKLINSKVDAQRNTGFGEWLEGREVKKLFGERYYSGTVTEYDNETGWYRVVYEDGDFEDLEWHELQDVLCPLDITVPLKALASKIIRKSQKSDSGSGRKVAGQRKHGAKTGARRGRLR